MTTEPKISRETAESNFQELLDYYDLNENYCSDDQAKLFTPAQNKIINSIMMGAIEITIGDTAMITQHLKSGDTVNYKEITGKAKVQMDKEKGDYGKVYSLLGSLSGLGAAGIAKMSGKDMSLAETLGFFFLMV